MTKGKNLGKLGMEYLRWGKDNLVGEIPYQVAREGAGENRIPFTHLANSLPTYLVFLKQLREARVASANILDVGCGTGRNISFVKQALNKQKLNFYGVDYSSACIDYAKSQYRAQGVVFIQHDGAKLPFPDHTFDYIVSSHVMEHIPKQHQRVYLKEIARVLKSGGLAIIGEPNRKYCQDLFCDNPSDARKYRLVLPHEHEHYMSELGILYGQIKAFSHYDIWQTENPICRELFMRSTARLRPQGNPWQRVVFEIYSLMRENHYIQDMLARVGTEWLIKKMGANYNQLVRATKLYTDSASDHGDNFIVVARKR